MAKKIYPAISMKQVLIEAVDGNMDAAYLKIPFDVKSSLGSMKPKVDVLFDAKVRYRGTIARHGTPFHFLLLTKAVRAKLGKQAGDKVDVLINLDTAPRVMEVPPLLQNALDNSTKEVRAFYASLSFTNQKEYVNYITSAKKEATKIRRMEKVMTNLMARKKSMKS